VRESLPPAQLQFQIESTEESISLRFSETNASELVRVPGQAELIFADILEYLQSVPAQEFKKKLVKRMTSGCLAPYGFL